jgi:hypothetical protein
MDILKDDEIGEFSYFYGWVRDYTILLFCRPIDVQLVIPCDEGDEIEETQRAAFLAFNAKKDDYTGLAERAIFDYYQTVCAAYRDRFGADCADELAPVVTDISQVKDLILATQVIIQQSFESGERVVGLMFNCSWEPELGLAVKFVNEVIEEVGTQDIVL